MFCDGWLKKAIHVSLFLLVSSQLLFSQNQTVTEYQVKAAFLYNFTQFVEWPQSAFAAPSDPFIIGIIGEDPFGPFLDETVEGEKFGSHPIQVKRFSDAKDISNCHILYIHLESAELTKKILKNFSGKSILSVSDDPNFYKWGGIVRFFTENNKIKLQVNVKQSRAAELNISSKLLSVSKTD